MSDRQAVAVGDERTYTRSFTDDDVAAFQSLSGDAGRHHDLPDAHGRRMVHGLLTASLPTLLGGQIDFVAREMHFEFVRPVFTGDTVRCTMTITGAEREPGRLRVTMRGACVNQHDKEVLRFQAHGVVLDAPG